MFEAIFLDFLTIFEDLNLFGRRAELDGGESEKVLMVGTYPSYR
jgi:hypothetical protein